ncbi:uncharacterized protein F4807DRAFT_413051 [Annulohypoxylon truncatum]|uniref:uncharacterized protein n=1 Tax=Annulohypoxylon truncatum TaxID=327061 RepID=UPI0020080B9F|nr:uncharacterized protein F4807DRAFT_413051 [Annulohypoxylon truncatum]KAI1213135.1 hypothetical protein F4807DRAFT_413051 [Annulohypoxylon truncatum]
MGHVDIVWFLVEQGAALTHDRVLASSYTGNEGLAARRRDFFLNTVGIGREHPDAENTRKIIFDILSSPGRRSVVRAMRGPRSDLGFPDYKLAKQGRDIVVFAPVLRIRSDIPLDRSKTIGIITSKAASGDILMSAHSGFRAGGDRHDKCLDTNQWNYVALHHIAKLLKFHFPGNKHDNGPKKLEDDIHRGRAHAGHVEVLLAAWYAVELTNKQRLAANGGQGKMSLDWCLANLHTLKHATLGQARSAVIMIDSQPCATCLKFINYLFQYTGVHFSVKGAVGIGPTLATKDERTGVRLDTFGDVFLEQDIDGADDYEESAYLDTEIETVLETPIAQGVPGGIRDTIEGNGDEEDDAMSVHAQAQAASEAFARISSFSPANMDTENVPMTTPAPEPVTPQRAAPFTPLRPRMRWGVPDSGPRSKRGDPFGNIPSRRPANPDELIAEYKKKTPVWTWPGYDSAEPSFVPFCQPPRVSRGILGSPMPLALPGAAGRTLVTDGNMPIKDINGDSAIVMDEGGTGEGPVTGEDPIIVDMVNDDVSYPSPPRSCLIRDTFAAFDAQVKNHFGDTPTLTGQKRAAFSYSSFQPIPNPARQKAKEMARNLNTAMEEPPLQPPSRARVDQIHSETPMQLNSPDDEEGYVHVPDLFPLSPSPQPQPLSQQSQPFSPSSQPPSQPQQPLLSQNGSRYYAAALLMGAESPDPTPCPMPVPTSAPNLPPSPAPTTTPSNSTTTAILTPAATPVPIPAPKTNPKPAAPGPLNFQRWRFEPHPHPQPRPRSRKPWLAEQQQQQEVVSKHFSGPRLAWHQQGLVSFPEVTGMGNGVGQERRDGAGRKG